MKQFKEYLPEITEEDMALISQPIDFMGQNIYNGYIVRCGIVYVEFKPQKRIAKDSDYRYKK